MTSHVREEGGEVWGRIQCNEIAQPCGVPSVQEGQQSPHAVSLGDAGLEGRDLPFLSGALGGGVYGQGLPHDGTGKAERASLDSASADKGP